MSIVNTKQQDTLNFVLTEIDFVIHDLKKIKQKCSQNL